MLRTWLLAIGLAWWVTGCLEDHDGEGQHLIVHFTSPAPFDTAFLSLDGRSPGAGYPTGGTTSYTYDNWFVFGGPSKLDATLAFQGNAIGSVAVPQIPYVSQGDGSSVAELTLEVTP